jgi:hypothetical protein
MRILADLASNDILQVEKTPPVGDPVPINGKYVVDVPEGAPVQVDANSYILNGGVVDAGSVVTHAFAGLLAQFPQYDNIVFNPLVIADDVNDLDLTASFMEPPDTWATRAQVGRGSVDPQEGLAPNSTAILPVNTAGSGSNRPGMLITDTIDISAATSGAGAREFVVYWRLYSFTTSDDVMSDYGATAGLNDPAIRSISEADQEPTDFQVYLSLDDGAVYFPVGRLEPIAFCVPGTSLRLAFRNDSASKIYLGNYALLF